MIFSAFLALAAVFALLALAAVFALFMVEEGAGFAFFFVVDEDEADVAAALAFLFFVEEAEADEPLPLAPLPHLFPFAFVSCVAGVSVDVGGAFLEPTFFFVVFEDDDDDNDEEEEERGGEGREARDWGDARHSTRLSYVITSYVLSSS